MKRWSLVTTCLMLFSIVSAVPVYAGNWVSNGSLWEYHENGQAAANKWIQSDGAWYFMDSNGNMVTNKWVKSSGNWYFLNSNGTMMANQWVQSGGVWYYVNANGSMAANQWIKSGSDWYYVDSNGSMVTGSRTIDGRNYVFLANGKMQETNYGNDNPLPPSKIYTDKFTYEKTFSDGSKMNPSEYNEEGSSTSPINFLLASKNSKITDKGSYYELTNVSFEYIRWNADHTMNSRYYETVEDTTVYIRKDAVVTLGDKYNNKPTTTMTAEDCYKKYGGFAIKTNETVLHSNTYDVFKIDSNGYIIAFNDDSAYLDDYRGR